MDFWKGVFSECGPGSTSRVLSALFGIAVCFCYVFVTVKSGRLPPAAEAISAGTFAATPYAIGQAKAAIAAFAKQ